MAADAEAGRGWLQWQKQGAVAAVKQLLLQMAVVVVPRQLVVVQVGHHCCHYWQDLERS